ncbi:glycosyltransferase [Phycisphaerales bacterium AB-hyl4]|uniref:Glycosyltransferase n=1 Tax=Natronomicrosphaera hydrolytica TaxID=3242702 RepID=A0ABV4U687_9BACT
MNSSNIPNTSPSASSASTERVVHLVEAASPQTCGTTLALLAMLRAEAGERSTVVLMGNSALSDLAEAAQLRGAHRVGVPFGRAVCGLPALRRVLSAVGPASQIVCWSAGSLLAARVLRPTTPRVMVAVQSIGSDAGRMVRWCLRWPGMGGTRVVTLGDALRTTLTNGPLRDWYEAVQPLPALALRPPVPSDARGVLRTRWGVSDERVKVVAMLADPPVVVDAQLGAIAASVARETLCDAGWPGQVAVLLHPDQWHRPRAQLMMENLGGHFPIVLEPKLATPWQVTAGCDLVMTMGPGAGGLALTSAMAAGLPIVAEPTPRVREWLTHNRNARLADSGEPRFLAHEITEMLSDPDSTGRLRLAARHTIAQRDEPIAPWLQALENCNPADTSANATAQTTAGHADEKPSAGKSADASSHDPDRRAPGYS